MKVNKNLIGAIILLMVLIGVIYSYGTFSFIASNLNKLYSPTGLVVDPYTGDNSETGGPYYNDCEDGSQVPVGEPCPEDLEQPLIETNETEIEDIYEEELSCSCSEGREKRASDEINNDGCEIGTGTLVIAVVDSSSSGEAQDALMGYSDYDIKVVDLDSGENLDNAISSAYSISEIQLLPSGTQIACDITEQDCQEALSEIPLGTIINCEENICSVSIPETQQEAPLGNYCIQAFVNCPAFPNNVCCNLGEGEVNREIVSNYEKIIVLNFAGERFNLIRNIKGVGSEIFEMFVQDSEIINIQVNGQKGITGNVVNENSGQIGIEDLDSVLNGNPSIVCYDLASCDIKDESGNVVGSDGMYVCAADACGNTQIDLGEECDDGNKENGDGCSSSCTVECEDSGTVEKTTKDNPIQMSSGTFSAGDVPQKMAELNRLGDSIVNELKSFKCVSSQYCKQKNDASYSIKTEPSKTVEKCPLDVAPLSLKKSFNAKGKFSGKNNCLDGATSEAGDWASEVLRGKAEGKDYWKNICNDNRCSYESVQEFKSSVIDLGKGNCEAEVELSLKVICGDKKESNSWRGWIEARNTYTCVHK